MLSLCATLLTGFSCTGSPDAAEASSSTFDFGALAPTPPMGWNSFDAYDCRINEEEFLATVDYMAEHLLPYGYEYAVIDYVWWHPEPGNWDNPRRYGHPNIRFNEDGGPMYPEYTRMDEYGRLIPAVERFPSAADGVGFKAIADYVHGKGLKFGIHIMRGIHHAAVYNKTPIKGTGYTADQVGEPWDQCDWCNHNMGVDQSRPGAQEYYNSIFELYAEWGVDFIKADDMMTKTYHKGDVEMMRKAIENSGRPMVLSLSCGEAPVSSGKHIAENSHMWRVSGDFWDRWDRLLHNFELLEKWSPFIGPGSWPDADMLPVGRLSLDNRPHGPERQTLFTWEEQTTLMSLWCIVRSPLMLGADLLSMDERTLELITNKEVLYVNQHSTDNRQVIRRNPPEGYWGNRGFAAWIATDPENGDRFLALFNLEDEPAEVCFDMEWEMLRGSYSVRDLWKHEDQGSVEGKLCRQLGPHDACLLRLSKI